MSRANEMATDCIFASAVYLEEFDLHALFAFQLGPSDRALWLVTFLLGKPEN